METQNKPTALQVPLTIDLSKEGFDNIARDLQLTEEREQELDDLFDEIWHKHSTVTSIMSDVAKEVKSVTELAYICFHLGVRVNKAKQLETIGGVIAAMMAPPK